MEYKEALEFLKNLTKFGMNFGLERIIKLLSLMGDPHKKLKVVHVGGTNGKGSTCIMLSNILKCSGYKVGFFSSPHIHCYRERFSIGGEMISEEKLAAIITNIKPYLLQMKKEGFEHPTEFEVNTAIAFQYFYEENVDLVILEVGLGGAIDSTNVIEKPLLAIITNVEMDHLDYLGNTITDIARVKAGIIKEESMVITGSDKKEALRVIEKVCSEKNGLLFTVGKEIKYKITKTSQEGTFLNYSGVQDYEGLKTPLLGEHQAKNAAIAVRAAEILKDIDFSRIDEISIRVGLENVFWPARFEIIQKNPTVLVDVAHNVDGMTVLKNNLKKLFNYENLILVISLLEDKEREKIVGIIAPLAKKIIVTKPDSYRAGDWKKVSDYARVHCPDVTVKSNIDDAVKFALKDTNEKDLLCITGSFYMVCDARKFLLDKKQLNLFA